MIAGMSDKRRKRSDRTKRRRPAPMTVHMRSVPNGPGIVSAPFEQVLAALRSAPDPADWATVGDLVVPVFPRRRPFSFDGPEPLRVQLPPGVLVGFGIDLGPAFAFVTEDMLERWPVTVDGLTAIALANLRERLGDSGPHSIQQVERDGVWMRVLQTGLGIASTTVLLPTELRRIFGTGPQRFVAPMRDLLVSLPLASDPDLAADLVADLAERDPNALAVEAFVLDRGGLRCEALGPVGGTA
jgi:hypothetical protein